MNEPAFLKVDEHAAIQIPGLMESQDLNALRACQDPSVVVRELCLECTNASS